MTIKLENKIKKDFIINNPLYKNKNDKEIVFLWMAKRLRKN